MDLSSLIPIVAVVIGVPGFVGFVALMVRHKHRMKELEIRDKELQMGGNDAALRPAVEALSEDLNEVRAHLADMQERLAFAERLLTAGKPPGTERGS